MAADDSGQRSAQVCQGIDRIELASLDERGDGRPVLGPGVVPGKEGVLPIEGNRPDGLLDAIVVDLNAAVGQEELQPSQYLTM